MTIVRAVHTPKNVEGVLVGLQGKLTYTVGGAIAPINISPLCTAPGL